MNVEVVERSPQHVQLHASEIQSYHFGGAFPHRDGPGTGTTDLWGRLPDWDRVHLVDGSVLPSVPSTTFTLTVMAIAHRIACGVLAGQAPAAAEAEPARH